MAVESSSICVALDSCEMWTGALYKVTNSEAVTYIKVTYAKSVYSKVDWYVAEPKFNFSTNPHSSENHLWYYMWCNTLLSFLFAYHQPSESNPDRGNFVSLMKKRIHKTIKPRISFWVFYSGPCYVTRVTPLV